ncbi:transposase, partial [bacterium]|nr:transposase [bacterium]
MQKFFDHLDHGHLRDFLDRRVRDGVLRRAIDKWLKAGVLEDGCVTHPDSGTPQGGVISPLLANIYLHEVVDTWFETQIKPRLAGRAALFRYADDFVIVFTSERDARRVLETLPKRLGRYGLSLHPDKTRLVDFRRPPFPRRGKRAGKRPRPGTLDLLGFTHFWGLSRRGFWVVWSVDASVTIPAWDRHGLERLVRYCARPPLSRQRLGRLNDETLVYSLRKPTL